MCPHRGLWNGNNAEVYFHRNALHPMLLIKDVFLHTTVFWSQGKTKNDFIIKYKSPIPLTYTVTKGGDIHTCYSPICKPQATLPFALLLLEFIFICFQQCRPPCKLPNTLHLKVSHKKLGFARLIETTADNQAASNGRLTKPRVQPSDDQTGAETCGSWDMNQWVQCFSRQVKQANKQAP